MSTAAAPPLFPSPKPTPSYWLREGSQLSDHRTTPDLPTSSDVVILGAGMTGIAALYHLTELAPHLSVTVIDARGVCEGATGRNAGMATPLAAHGFRSRVEALGSVRAALDTVAFERKCVSELVATIDALGLREYVQLRQGGVLNLAESEAEWRGMLADLAYYREHTVSLKDNDVEEIHVLDPAALAREFHTAPDGFFGGIYSSLGFQLWPYRLVTALAQHCLAVNPDHVNLQTHTLALGVSRQPDGTYAVRTARGTIAATAVIHATNAYVGQLVPTLRDRVVPVRGQMVAGKLRGNPDAVTWRAGLAFNEGLEYFQNRDDGTVLLGGGREFAARDDTPMEVGQHDDAGVNLNISEGLVNVFARRFAPGPELDVTQTWTGIMGFSSNAQPVVGRLHSADPSGRESRQFAAVGYTGHGMPRCFLAAKNVVLAVLGREGELDSAVRSCFAVPDSAVEPNNAGVAS
ncbi:hypothetical protein H9P43_007105 [Blastocladiella emersonii ATCC 22665]|nr:hypothetical protein H9P43_007105 [Blastocladiella emersonii ATCC 22665]